MNLFVGEFAPADSSLVLLKPHGVFGCEQPSFDPMNEDQTSLNCWQIIVLNNSSHAFANTKAGQDLIKYIDSKDEI